MDPELSSKMDTILTANTADEWLNVEKCIDDECHLCNPVVDEKATMPAERFERCMICFNDRVPPCAAVHCRVHRMTFLL